jgi:hypothetical protein
MSGYIKDILLLDPADCSSYSTGVGWELIAKNNVMQMMERQKTWQSENKASRTGSPSLKYTIP